MHVDVADDHATGERRRPLQHAGEVDEKNRHCRSALTRGLVGRCQPVRMTAYHVARSAAANVKFGV